MADISPKPVKITETVLRDAHQSLIATRMPTSMMLPIIDKMDKVGYNAVECWGGATFDAVSFVMDLRTQSFRCFSEVRTS